MCRGVVCSSAPWSSACVPVQRQCGGFIVEWQFASGGSSPLAHGGEWAGFSRWAAAASLLCSQVFVPGPWHRTPSLFSVGTCYFSRLAAVVKRAAYDQLAAQWIPKQNEQPAAISHSTCTRPRALPQIPKPVFSVTWLHLFSSC